MRDPYLLANCTDEDIEAHFGDGHGPEEPPEYEQCAYCVYEVPVWYGVPAVDDDEAWEKLLEHHADDCEWVVTRAHRKL